MRCYNMGVTQDPKKYSINGKYLGYHVVLYGQYWIYIYTYIYIYNYLYNMFTYVQILRYSNNIWG